MWRNVPGRITIFCFRTYRTPPDSPISRRSEMRDETDWEPDSRRATWLAGSEIDRRTCGFAEIPAMDRHDAGPL